MKNCYDFLRFENIKVLMKPKSVGYNKPKIIKNEAQNNEIYYHFFLCFDVDKHEFEAIDTILQKRRYIYYFI